MIFTNGLFGGSNPFEPWIFFWKVVSFKALKMIALNQQLKDPQLVRDGNNDEISITLMEF